MFDYIDRENIVKLTNMNLQLKNKLKFLLLPSSESLGLDAGSLGGAGLSLLGNVVTTLYLQSLDFPSGLTIEYDEISKKPKALIKPDTVSATFIEDEKGTVWRYFQTWRKTIAYVVPSWNVMSSNVEYVFADNQEASERIGILILQPSKKIGYKFPRIMFYGLKFKNIEQLQVGYTDGGNLTYTVVMTVKEIAAPLV